MEMIFGVLEAGEFVRDDEPSTSTLSEMAAAVREIAERAGYPVTSVRPLVERLGDHLKSRGEIAVTPGWMLDNAERPKLASHVENVAASRGVGYDPFIVSFIISVDSSG